MSREAIVWGALILLSGCVQPYQGLPVTQADRSRPSLATQDQTVGIEEQDRIRRFQRLADLQGITPPDVDQVMLPAGSVDFMSGPVPVVRVVFPERAFFAFDSAIPLPSSEPILDVIAENMKRDVPDAALTVLGHTDAIGTDAYNLDLSLRRAETVMQALVARGVSPDLLSEVAIGKRQPIAPNDTPQGRALNRRVEFLISPALSANLAAVQQRVVPASYFSTSEVQQRNPAAETTKLATVANVYKLNQKAPTSARTPEGDQSLLAPLGGLQLSPPSPGPVALNPVSPPSLAPPSPPEHTETTMATPVAPNPVSPNLVVRQSVQPVEVAPPMPAAPVTLIPPSEVTPRQLGEDNTPY
jgi:outer membrane protein OmpA-like peptidoglycan-associated protein